VGDGRAFWLAMRGGARTQQLLVPLASLRSARVLRGFRPSFGNGSSGIVEMGLRSRGSSQKWRRSMATMIGWPVAPVGSCWCPRDLQTLGSQCSFCGPRVSPYRAFSSYFLSSPAGLF
jgi:hypothetical protein